MHSIMHTHTHTHTHRDTDINTHTRMRLFMSSDKQEWHGERTLESNKLCMPKVINLF
jgi:hypothetical protein